MDKQLDGMLDIAIMVIIMAMGIAITAASLRAAELSVSAAIREKTVVAANSDNTPKPPVLDGKDVLLMLAVQDVNLPTPRQLCINGHPAIKFNSAWFADIDRNIGAVWDSYLKNLFADKVTEIDTAYSSGIPSEWDILLAPEGPEGAAQ